MLFRSDVDGRPYADLAEMAKRIVAAAAQARIGLTLLPSFYAYGGFGGAPPSTGQRRFINDPDRFLDLVERTRAAVSAMPGASVGIAPHSLRAVTPATLRSVCQAAPEGPIHIHAAEQVREVEDCIAALGRRPVEWPLENVGLDARWCVVHATHTTESELKALATSEAVVGLCPLTEAFRWRHLSGSRRTLRHRNGFEHPDRRRVGVAAVGILAAAGATCPQYHDIA